MGMGLGWGRGGRTRLVVAVLAALIGVACPARASIGRRSDPNPALPGSQGCLGGAGESSSAPFAWGRLRNPILAYDTSAVRDIGIRLRHGQWHLYFTSLSTTGTWRIATATTRDLVSWTRQAVWPPQSGVAGVASPDVTRRPDGAYVITYESDPNETKPPGEDKIYHRTSADLVQWSGPRRLMPTIHSTPSERVIDPALAWTRHGLFLGYKFGGTGGQQHFEMAWSPSGSVDGPWTYLGRPDISVYGDTIENYQFLEIDGVWTLLATSNSFDRPWLFRLAGNPADPTGWLHWSPGRELEVPAEAWNRAPGIPSVNFELANSAYLCDARRIDGHFYLFYVGTNELHTYGGWGHTKLGVARSTDLVRWEVPCRSAGVSTPVGCEPGG